MQRLVSTSRSGEATRGRIHTGKIAGVETSAHEKTLPFCEVQISCSGSKRGSSELGVRSSTKGLVSDEVQELTISNAVFYRIHDQFEPVFDFEFAID